MTAASLISRFRRRFIFSAGKKKSFGGRMHRTVQSEQKTRSFQTALDLTTDAKINVSVSETESSCFTHSWTELGDDGVMARPRKTVQ